LLLTVTAPSATFQLREMRENQGASARPTGDLTEVSVLRLRVAKVAQHRKIHEKPLFLAYNYLKQAFEFRPVV